MPGLEEAFERIGDAVEHHLPQTHAAGFALAVTDPEDVLGVVVRGLADVAASAPVRPETRFQIGSISKSFAGIVAMQEVEAGRLALDVSINELVPWLGLAEPFGPITLHHLMTHTSGLPIGTEESPTGPGALSILRTLEPTMPPGERFWYSNDGWKLVGAVLERLTGTPMDELLRERILVPLGMTSTEGAITNETRMNLAVGYEPMFDDRPPHLGHPLAPARWIVSGTADGSIVSNVLDMSAYARMLLGGGSTLVDGHERTVLSLEGFDRFVEPRVLMDEPGRPQGERYGYGLWTLVADGRTFALHSGGMVGYTALLMIDVDTGIAAIALQNGEATSSRSSGTRSTRCAPRSSGSRSCRCSTRPHRPRSRTPTRSRERMSVTARSSWWRRGTACVSATARSVSSSNAGPRSTTRSSCRTRRATGI